jgi:hypothetical protein
VRQHFYKLAMIVVLGSGFAIAQSTPQQQPASPSTQPSSTDQQPSTAPADQNKTPDSTLPNTDQNKDNQGAQKMPQSDAAPAAAAAGDVQGNIQSAIQKDPTLASSNITVDVKNGKEVDLTGTVPSKDAKDAAERIAKENAGGMKVKSHLKVASATDATQPKSNDLSNPKL